MEEKSHLKNRDMWAMKKEKIKQIEHLVLNIKRMKL